LFNSWLFDKTFFPDDDDERSISTLSEPRQLQIDEERISSSAGDSSRTVISVDDHYSHEIGSPALVAQLDFSSKNSSAPKNNKATTASSSLSSVSLVSPASSTTKNLVDMMTEVDDSQVALDLSTCKKRRRFSPLATHDLNNHLGADCVPPKLPRTTATVSPKFPGKNGTNATSSCSAMVPGPGEKKPFVSNLFLVPFLLVECF